LLAPSISILPFPCFGDLCAFGLLLCIAFGLQFSLFGFDALQVALSSFCIRSILLLPQYPLGFPLPLLCFEAI
jgi:hypothetical protein